MDDMEKIEASTTIGQTKISEFEQSTTERIAIPFPYDWKTVMYGFSFSNLFT